MGEKSSTDLHLKENFMLSKFVPFHFFLKLDSFGVILKFIQTRHNSPCQLGVNDFRASGGTKEHENYTRT